MALLEITDLQAPGMQQPISWQINAGQLWLLYGTSGSGKSQFLKAIADLINHQGSVSLQGKAAESIYAPNWRRQVMYFAAETAWWLDTIAEHFSELPSKATLTELGLSESVLDEHPDKLSSGEKQRLALLRGLAFQPKVLLLDETSANLDPESTLKLESFIQKYLQGGSRAAVWVSHDPAQRERLACPTYCCSLEELAEGKFVQEVFHAK